MCWSGKCLKKNMSSFVLRGYFNFGRKQQIKHFMKTKHELHSVFQPESHKCFLAAATISSSACDQTEGKLH